MKILLVRPYYSHIIDENFTYNRKWPPICLANCASELEGQGHQVKILDAHLEGIKPYEIIRHTKGYDKVFVTSSSLDRWQCPNLKVDDFVRTAKRVREQTEELYIMGFHATAEPDKILELTSAKTVILGEPEGTVAEICTGKSLTEIEGIVFRTNGKLVANPRRSPADLNRLPLPAYHLLRTDKYSYEILGENFMLFETSRGCPYSCGFCSKIMYGQEFRRKSFEKIIEELNVAIVNFGIKSGYFIDLDFLANRETVERICDYLIKRRYDFKWCCQTRVDEVDKELLVKMKKAGCRLIHFGIESGSLRILQAMNKHTDLGRVREGIRLTEETGIKTACFFLLGFESENSDDIEQTVRFIRRAKPSYITFHIATPYPGSDLYKAKKLNMSISVLGSYIRKSCGIFKRIYLLKVMLGFYLVKKGLRPTFSQLRLFMSYICKIVR